LARLVSTALLARHIAVGHTIDRGHGSLAAFVDHGVPVARRSVTLRLAAPSELRKGANSSPGATPRSSESWSWETEQKARRETMDEYRKQRGP
jgi:hypothetical protein